MLDSKVLWALAFKTTSSGKISDTPLAISSPIRHLQINGEKLNQFCHTVGWGHHDTLPPTFLQVQAFADCLELMALPSFPFKALGLVHIKNTIVTRASISPGDNLSIRTIAENVQPHRRGYTFDFVTSITREGQEVYQAKATNLAMLKTRTQGKHKQHEEHRQDLGLSDEALNIFKESLLMERSIGRRYAKISGDFNPIHLFAVTAKLFGFRRAIAHGMYCKAACLSRIPRQYYASPYRIETQFFSPVYLPSKPDVRITCRHHSEASFKLQSPNKTHLTGALSHYSK